MEIGTIEDLHLYACKQKGKHTANPLKCLLSSKEDWFPHCFHFKTDDPKTFKKWTQTLWNEEKPGRHTIDKKHVVVFYYDKDTADMFKGADKWIAFKETTCHFERCSFNDTDDILAKLKTTEPPQGPNKKDEAKNLAPMKKEEKDEAGTDKENPKELRAKIDKLGKEMKTAAAAEEFEKARKLKKEMTLLQEILDKLPKKPTRAEMKQLAGELDKAKAAEDFDKAANLKKKLAEMQKMRGPSRAEMTRELGDMISKKEKAAKAEDFTEAARLQKKCKELQESLDECSSEEEEEEDDAAEGTAAEDSESEKEEDGTASEKENNLKNDDDEAKAKGISERKRPAVTIMKRKKQSEKKAEESEEEDEAEPQPPKKGRKGGGKQKKHSSAAKAANAMKKK